MRPLYIVNNYGQFNHLIKRMLRDLDLDAVMISNETPADEVAEGCRGIILGGGPSLDRAGCAADYLDLGLPVLGICLGLHIITVANGGSVKKGHSGGFGGVDVEILDHTDILEGYPDNIRVWASHADEVREMPDGFSLLARSDICGVEAMANMDKHIYGIQWHPEVSHSVDGKRVYENFNRLTIDLL